MAAHAAVIALVVVGAVCGKPETALNPLASLELVPCMLKILGRVGEAVIEQQHKAQQRAEQESARRQLQAILNPGAVHADANVVAAPRAARGGARRPANRAHP